MLNRIRLNLDVLEMMIYYWDSVSSRERVSDSYFVEIAEKENMKYLYNEEFTRDSVRKVLSAISNREKLSNTTKAEGRFWNNNMWILEDMELTNMMVQPVKTLNLDGYLEELREKCGFEEIEVAFIPGHLDECYMYGNKLIINFFRVNASPWDDSVKIEGVDFKEYIHSKLIEMVNI